MVGLENVGGELIVAQATGAILAIGAITMVNQSLFHDEPLAWKVPVATAVAAGAFALGEKAWPKGVVALAWMALATVLLTRTDPRVPSPLETAADWWKKQ